ncbi:MAG: murein hydrolase activator EnvC family protein [Cytophagaceae bacterium]
MIKQKEENLKKIAEAHKILEETRSQKDATLGQLSALKQQINARHALINSISGEIELLDKEIRETEEFIFALEADMEFLKKEYAEMIYAASKFSTRQEKLTFIFASQNFNQLVRRVKYFQQYSSARKNQVEQIEKVKISLARERERLYMKREQKTLLVMAKSEEAKNLQDLKKQQDEVVKQLTDREKELKKELEDSKKAVKKLEKLITDLIREEKAKAAREAARLAKEAEEKAGRKPNKDNTVTTTTVKIPTLTPEAEKLSNSFAGNMSKLPWPVVHGNISHRFGKQPHPVLKGVIVENLGVDILTLKNEPVRSVFDGKVITVAEVPGMNYVVMIQHGEYFTVYAKLKTTLVKTGQEVKAKDPIGTVYTDKNDVSELQFQVWKNNEKLDPEKWLFIK